MCEYIHKWYTVCDCEFDILIKRCSASHLCTVKIFKGDVVKRRKRIETAVFIIVGRSSIMLRFAIPDIPDNFPQGCLDEVILFCCCGGWGSKGPIVSWMLRYTSLQIMSLAASPEYLPSPAQRQYQCNPHSQSQTSWTATSTVIASPPHL
ncbi:uncharacterized protein H6S33_007989 [Morchella sextelata]|uniref:uncharacterized protein n=1 Tax=Morchella sextelata TaxID=1174677 RepID=UPI001D039E8E|nr:uncharacterized protein H6S33_007989 [Morchella sextelata]KAH0602985.1 hypothetical protein H6S33_007989 [Morchella sextelata]